MSLSYNIPSNESIFDALIKISVPIDSTVSILKANDYNLNTDFFTEKGVLDYEESEKVTIKGGQIVIKPSSGVSKYTTNSTQNIFDVCLMTNGDIDKIVLMAKENDSIFDSINANVGGVLVVNYNDSDVTDNGFKLTVKKSGINFTTGDIADIEDYELFLLQENGYNILLENGNYLLY